MPTRPMVAEGILETTRGRLKVEVKPSTIREVIVSPTSLVKLKVVLLLSGKNAFGPNSALSQTVEGSS